MSSESGFGHNFEREVSIPEPGLENSTSDHSVIRYQMGNLNCVVRFDVDVCCPQIEGKVVGSKVELWEHHDIILSFERLKIDDA